MPYPEMPLVRMIRKRAGWLSALVGVVTFGSLAGSMLPFLLRQLGFDPASASAPFVATLSTYPGS